MTKSVRLGRGAEAGSGGSSISGEVTGSSWPGGPGGPGRGGEAGGFEVFLNGGERLIELDEVFLIAIGDGVVRRGADEIRDALARMFEFVKTDARVLSGSETESSACGSGRHGNRPSGGGERADVI
jgi:hypothetical protein